MKVRHISRMVVKMMIALFISARSEVEPATTAIGAKTVAISVRKAFPGSSRSRQKETITMVVARLMGMIAK